MGVFKKDEPDIRETLLEYNLAGLSEKYYKNIEMIEKKKNEKMRL